MKYKELLLRSKEHLEEYPGYSEVRFSPEVFLSGAQWMTNRLNELDYTTERKFDRSVNFNSYGIAKYTFCLFTFLISTLIFSHIDRLLVPLSLLIFYFFEAHLIFLFPLIIDKVKNPIIASIKYTYDIGILKAMFTVMPIGFYMIGGLVNRKDPFLNWHIGCLSILFWYKDEVRNRLH